MGDGVKITLEGQAVEEILREAKRSKELVNDFGVYGGRRRDVLPNKRFLNNTLVSTLRHSYREEKKHKDGSNRKFQQHMNTRRRRGRNYYRNQGDREEIVEPENNQPEPDYGEFDAIAYTEKCTDLYIQDSHRKHFFMRGNFVEKCNKDSSSESGESFTEYDDPPADKWKHDRFEGKWSDTGSADEIAAELEEKSGSSENEDDIEINKPSKSTRQKGKYLDKSAARKDSGPGRNAQLSGKRRKDKYYQDAGTSKDDREMYIDEITDDDDIIDSPTKKVKKERQDMSETDEHSDEDFVNSGTESADNMEKHNKNKGKGKKTRKLPDDGKELWEKISSRSMYADIEEMKMSKSDPKFVEPNLQRKEDRTYPKQIKLEKNERRQNYLKQKSKNERVEEEMQRVADRNRKEEQMRDEAERERKEESMRRLAERNRKEKEERFEDERQEENRRVADEHWKEEQMRRAAFEHFRGVPQRRPFRGRPFMRPGRFFRGRPPRGFRGGLPMFPPVNPFYASLFYQMDPYLFEKFIKEHGYKLLKKFRRSSDKSDSSSRSRSHSRSRSRRYKKKRRNKYSESDSSYSRDRSRSRSRRRSSYSRSHSRDRTRSHSRDRTRSHSRSRRRYSSSDYRSRSRSGRSRSRSRRSRSRSRRSRSRSRSRSRRSRSRSRSKSKYRKRSYSYESKSSSKERSHRSRSRSSRKHKKHRKHKRSKHRKHSKSKQRSKKSTESESEDEKNNENDKDSDKDTDNETIDSESEESVVNEAQISEYVVEQEEQSEGEIVSDENDGLENVSEESGEAWSSSSEEEGALESD